MRIKQVSVFVSNEPGHLSAMLRPLADNQIDIQALSVAESTDYGIVRMVVSDTEVAIEALHAAQFATRVTDVLAYEMPNLPGGLLNTIIDPLAKAGINVEYFYAFTESAAGKARVVFKVSDPERAEQVLGKS